MYIGEGCSSLVPRPRFPTAAGGLPAAVGNLGLGTKLGMQRVIRQARRLGGGGGGGGGRWVRSNPPARPS